jgi:formylglycine-generating enzyme
MADDGTPNPFHLMLDLPENLTSPDHYELLSLKRFQSDEKRIREVAIDANQKLLAWQNSQYHAECDHLMDMVVQARDVLLDPLEKTRYNERLRRRLGIDKSVGETPMPTSLDGQTSQKSAPTEETAPHFDKVFSFGLGGLVALLVLVGAVVLFVDSSPPPLLHSPFNETAATESRHLWSKFLGEVPEITNGVEMTFVLISPGEFMMGSPNSDTQARFDEEPQHRIRITRPFYLQTTEVTQGQWETVMGTTPWRGQQCVKEGSDYAACYVSWNDAQEFCLALSKKDGKTYRLPTEAEWEYACRGGTTTVYHFGSDVSDLGEYAWWGGMVGNGNCKSEQYAHQVRRKKPNAFGLHDMHGNVFEWCQDCYGGDYYASPPAADPVGPTFGSSRVLRGGSWYYDAEPCRSANRSELSPDYRSCYIGFRVVRELK